MFELDSSMRLSSELISELMTSMSSSLLWICLLSVDSWLTEPVFIFLVSSICFPVCSFSFSRVERFFSNSFFNCEKDGTPIKNKNAKQRINKWNEVKQKKKNDTE